MSRTRYYTATSLDGFIADAANSLEWLLTRKSDEDGQLSLREFTAGVGAMAMGSTTYEWILDHEAADGGTPDDASAGWTWPPKVPCWVLTHRRLPVVPGAPIRFTSGDVRAIHEEMVAAAGGRDVWVVGGGDVAGQFADVGLLDDVLVLIAPVTLGGGAPLLPRRIELILDEAGRNGDFVVARFSVASHLRMEARTRRA